MDTGNEVHWPWLDVLYIFSKSGQAPGRSFPGSAGITTLPVVYDTMDMGPGKVSPKAGVKSIQLGFIDMVPGNATDPWFFMLTSINSASHQFSNSTTGNEPFSNDSEIHNFYTATLLGHISILDDTAGTCLVISHDIISCVTVKPSIFAPPFISLIGKLELFASLNFR